MFRDTGASPTVVVRPAVTVLRPTGGRHEDGARGDVEALNRWERQAGPATQIAG